jgi:hypothetical protein
MHAFVMSPKILLIRPSLRKGHVLVSSNKAGKITFLKQIKPKSRPNVLAEPSNLPRQQPSPGSN